MPPPTTKRMTITNLKTKNDQNCQKIEKYGSLKTKELKKQSSIPVEGWRLAARVEGTHSKAVAGGVGEVAAGGPGESAAGGTVVPHSSADKLGGTTGEQGRLGNRRFQRGEIKPQNL